MRLSVIKAHAYGNDFLFVETTEGRIALEARPALTRRLCHRHEGIGADGVIFYGMRTRGAVMSLLNADGSASELSGNGLRCLSALVARAQHLDAGAEVAVDTDAGTKTLALLGREGERYTFRAALGEPEGIHQTSITLAGETLTASILRLGNPQCIVLGPLPDEARFARIGAALATHEMFPAGTNVEFAAVESPDRVRILIWERGVGPTTSSGTGASASAVAAAAHGGAARDVQVVAPGGAQRVEWRQDGVYLTGWAEIVFTGEWLG